MSKETGIIIREQNTVKQCKLHEITSHVLFTCSGIALWSRRDNKKTPQTFTGFYNNKPRYFIIIRDAVDTAVLLELIEEVDYDGRVLVSLLKIIDCEKMNGTVYDYKTFGIKSISLVPDPL